MLIRLAIALLFLLATGPGFAADPERISIWPQGAPGSEARAHDPEIVENSYVRSVHNPTLTVFRADPSHANGAAVVIAPGGGHRMLVFVNEGIMPAKTLNRFGITVFVLKYRLAREQGSTYSIERDAAADARRAIRWVRAHAADYGLDPRRVGLMGFSAGTRMETRCGRSSERTARFPDPGLSGPARHPRSDDCRRATRLHRRRQPRCVLRAALACAVQSIAQRGRVGRTAYVRRHRSRV
jgi:hypothetical protein